MDCDATDIGKGKKKGLDKVPFAHMASERIFVYFVMEVVFLSTRNRNALVRSITREREKGIGQSTIVHMARKSLFMYFVVVVRCAKPHTVLSEETLSMLDTVGIALPICFRISLLYGIFERRRPLLQLFL